MQNASIAAVSCPSSGTCMAVGRYFDRSGFWVTLAQSWDGTTWRPRPVPNPPRATGITLSGVSCTTARACTAVGFYINSVGDELTLAEAWNGTSWKVETTPAPARSRQSELAGVSCTAAHACTAVGSYSTPSPANLTLAEAGP